MKKKKNHAARGSNRKSQKKTNRLEQIWMWALATLLIAGLVLLAVLLFSPDEPHEHEDEPTVDYAADFAVYDASGKQLALSELRGKPVVVNFWATWCPYCLEEMPDFEEAYKKYGKDVTFLMVNATTTQGETKEKAAAYIEEQGYTFPVCYDLAGKATSAHKITSYPTTLFIAADGSLALKKTGMLTASALEEGIQKIK